MRILVNLTPLYSHTHPYPASHESRVAFCGCLGRLWPRQIRSQQWPTNQFRSSRGPPHTRCLLRWGRTSCQPADRKRCRRQRPKVCLLFVLFRLTLSLSFPLILIPLRDSQIFISIQPYQDFPYDTPVTRTGIPPHRSSEHRVPPRFISLAQTVTLIL